MRALALFGPYIASSIFPKKYEFTPVGIAVSVAIATVAFAVFLGVENYLFGLGYVSEPLFKFDF